MMLAVQDGHVALRIVLLVNLGYFSRSFSFRERFPLAVAHPSALLARGGVNVEQARRLAVLLKLILDVAFKREWLGMGEIDACVVQVLAVVDTDRNQARSFGMRLIAGPLVDRDGAQVRRVGVGLGDLAGILRGGGEGKNQRGRSEQRRCLYPQAV